MKKIIFFSVILMLFSCSKPEEKGGIIFTFDDQPVQNWVTNRNLFKKYDVKATFFISNPGSLDQSQINGLKILQGDGHEIACFGLKHLDARTYTGPAGKFYEEEAEPAISKLNDLGFKVVSFAYPFGLAPDSIDSVMLKHVKYLRKATWNMYFTMLDYYDNIYAKPDSFKVVNSMGIDCNFNITPESLETGIQKARKNNEVLVLRAHKIDKSGADNTINPLYLEKAFKLCKKDRIRFLRMQDLEDFFSRANITATK